MRKACFLLGFLIGAVLVVATAGPAIAGWMDAQSAAVAERTTLPQ